MIEFYKKRGETPLQALMRLRKEQPEYKESKLSYAGRLDPMAEGVLPVLVGEEENKNRKEFLNKNKIYKAEFLIGCATDTGDILGLIEKKDFKKIELKDLEYAIKKLSTIKKQTYPWFSSKTVQGIPLFEYALKKDFSVVRPERGVKIYKVSEITVKEVESKKIIQNIITDIQKVEGNFRQKKILDMWNNLIGSTPGTVQLVVCHLEVSSGTYIRGLTESIESTIKSPVLLYRLVRTRVF